MDLSGNRPAARVPAWALAGLAAAACSSSKPKQIEDARKPAPVIEDAAVAPIAIDAAPPPATTGDIQVRVEWPNAPLAARTSPGPSACGTPLAAQVTPTTTWGIPEVIVLVDGAAPAASDARVTVTPCAITPRLAIGSAVTIASAAEQPVRLTLAPEKAKGGLAIALPIAGHAVTTTLEADARYELTAGGKTASAWIVANAAGITDATGAVIIKDVPPGKHAVRVWLPPRGGQPARSAKGEVDVAIGDLADITLAFD